MIGRVNVRDKMPLVYSKYKSHSILRQHRQLERKVKKVSESDGGASTSSGMKERDRRKSEAAQVSDDEDDFYDAVTDQEYTEFSVSCRSPSHGESTQGGRWLEGLYESDKLNFHPLINTATITIKTSDFVDFMVENKKKITIFSLKDNEIKKVI